MNRANPKPGATPKAPSKSVRVFKAPQELVFEAWSSAEHLRQWFCPAGHTVPEARIEFRVGGAFDLCMRSPTGQEYWTRGHYTQIVPHSRLLIDMQVFGDAPGALFGARLDVEFATEAEGTRLEVLQTYTPIDPASGPMIQGAPLGWRQTLDRLEEKLARDTAAQTADSAQPDRAAPARTAVHAIFSIERTYKAAPAVVFQALTDPLAKAQWFAGPPGYTELERVMDVRPGGRELLKGRWPNGMVSTFDAIYHDLVPAERIIYSYAMYLDERRISVSLTTFELKAAGSGTRLVFTEQGAFLDGYDDAGARERGSVGLIDALGRALQE